MTSLTLMNSGSNSHHVMVCQTSHSHQGCKCPPEFEGEHCEYVKGMAPTSSSNSSSNGTDVERAYAQQQPTTTTSVEFSPALTVEHTKNSKELSVPDEEGELPAQSTASGVRDPIIEVAKSSTDEPVTQSKNSFSNSVLQSNTIITIQTKSPSKTAAVARSDPFENAHEPTINSSNKANTGSIFGLIISVMGITLFGAALFLRNRRQRKLRSRIVHDHSSQHLASLDRNNYTDETPIRVRIMAEDEVNELELDEVLGEDDDVVSVGECSLEEIELEDNGGVGTYGEYLRNISDEFGCEGQGVEVDVDIGDEMTEQSSGYFPNIFA